MAASPAAIAPMTVYEFLEWAAPSYRNGRQGKYTNLYYQCARFVSLFTIADLRHDFEIELDIPHGDKTIGQWLCEFICDAYYDTDPKYNELLSEIREIYDENLTSDTTAKNYIKRELANFYNTIITPNRAIWGLDYYVAPFDDIGSEPLYYETESQKNAAYQKVSNNSDGTTVVLVDAQMGNPLERLFTGKPRSSYIYNYASALDAASKCTGTVQEYMDSYIQYPIPNPYAINKTFTGFGTDVNVEFTYLPISDTDERGTWKTAVQVDIEGTQIAETISPYDKASVDSLALIPVRGGLTKAELDQKVKTLDAIDIEQTIANHIFKSLGDRLQTYSMMRRNRVGYAKVTDVRTNDFVKPRSELVFEGKHVIQFTNDILENINNYLMQINTVFTGLHKITYYEYLRLRPLDKATVLAFFTPAKITEIYNSIIEFNTLRSVNVFDVNTIMNTLYSACTAKNSIQYCLTNPLFRLFMGGIQVPVQGPPSPANIATVITDATYRQFASYMSGDIKNHILEKNAPIEITKEELNRIWYNEIRTNLENMNENISISNVDEIYFELKQIVLAFAKNIQLIGIINHAELLVLCMFILENKHKKVINYFFEKEILFDKLTSIIVGKRTLLSSLIATDSHLPVEQQPVLRVLIMTLSNMVRGVSVAGIYGGNPIPVTNLDTANQLKKEISDYSQTYLQGQQANPYIRNIFDATGTAMMFFDMAINIKLIRTVITQPHPDRLASQIGKIEAAKIIISEILKKNSFLPFEKSIVKAGFAGSIAKKSKDRAERIIIRIVKTKEGKFIAGPRELDAMAQSIVSKLGGGQISKKTVKTKLAKTVAKTIARTTLKGGGSRSRKLNKFEELCMKKLEFMIDLINSPDNSYAYNTLLYLANIFNLIVDDYDALKKSRSKPRVLKTSILQTSLLSQRMSTIREEGDEGQTGGSRSAVPSGSTVLVQGDGKASAKWAPLWSGSKIFGMRTSKQISPPKRSAERFPGTGRKLTEQPVARASRLKYTMKNGKLVVEQEKKTKTPEPLHSVTILSRKEGISRVEKQLIAFFWLGLNLSDKHVEFERTLFADLLPIDGIFAVSNIVNQIFWQPFFNHCKEPCENIYNIFTNEYLPMMKQTLSAPPVLRRSGSPRRSGSKRSGSKRSTTRKRSKAASV